MVSFDEFKKRRGNKAPAKKKAERPLPQTERLAADEAAERRKNIFERRAPNTDRKPRTDEQSAKRDERQQKRNEHAARTPFKRSERPAENRTARSQERQRSFTSDKPLRAALNREAPTRTIPFSRDNLRAQRTQAPTAKPAETKRDPTVDRAPRGTRNRVAGGAAPVVIPSKRGTFVKTPREAKPWREQDRPATELVRERRAPKARSVKEVLDIPTKPKKKRSGKPRSWDPYKRKRAAIEPPKPPGTPERVQKLITAAGIAPRREAERMIEKGVVTVNGEVIKLGDKATEKDDIQVNGIRLTFPKKIYIMVNKPKGFVTTVKDIYGNKTVMDLVPDEERIYPVGRLDKDTTGLLLFTNDGEFANRLMHPRYEIQKTYIATLDKPFDPIHIKQAEKGIWLKEGEVRATVKILASKKVSVTLHQGFNHVVKRMMKEMGYWVRELERVKVGPLTLNIPNGAFRYLTEEEVKQFSLPTQE